MAQKKLLFSKRMKCHPFIIRAGLVAMLGVGLASSGTAGIKTWGNTGTDFNNAANWVGGKLPKVTDFADFSGPELTNPNLSASFELLGVTFSAANSSGYTLSSSSSAITLSLDSTLNGTSSALYTANTAGTNTISAGIIFNAAVGSTQTIDVGAGGTLTLSGVISSTNNVTIAKEGTGILTLSGANTYAGGTSLNAGTLNINNASAIGTGAFTINGGTIDNTTAGAITLTSNNAITLAGDFTFGGTHNLNLGTGAITNGSANGTITLNGTNSTLTLGGIMTNTLNATQTTTVNGVGNTLVLGGYNLGTGNANLTDIINGNGNVNITGVIANGGAKANSGLTYSGTGTLTLGGANTYTGLTTLNSGTLNINNAGSGGKSSAIGTGAFTINGGTIDNTSGGALTLSTNNAVTIGGNFTFGGTNNLNFGTGAVTNGGNRTITLNGTNSTLTFGGIMSNTLNAGQTTTVNGAGNTLVLGGYTLNNANQADTIKGSGNVTISGAISNGGKSTSGLTYSGTGTLTLSGTNTYGGATTVSSGTVLVNGSNSGTGAVSVNNSGTTLGGAGTTAGAVTVGNGAILRGGTGSAASGTLTLSGGLNLNSGSIIQLALGASGAHSTLARTGTNSWTFASGQAFNFINLGAQPGLYDNIITGLGSDPGGEGSWTITNAGWIGTFSWDGANIDLNVAAVPEPATCLAGFLAFVALGYHQRRRLCSLLHRYV